MVILIKISNKPYHVVGNFIFGCRDREEFKGVQLNILSLRALLLISSPNSGYKMKRYLRLISSLDYLIILRAASADSLYELQNVLRVLKINYTINEKRNAVFRCYHNARVPVLTMIIKRHLYVAVLPYNINPLRNE